MYISAQSVNQFCKSYPDYFEVVFGKGVVSVTFWKWKYELTKTVNTFSYSNNIAMMEDNMLK